MPIKVTLPKSFILKGSENVANEYNSRKDSDKQILEVLQCAEGAFKIFIKTGESYKVLTYVNYLYNLMRWNRSTLVSFYNYPAFSNEEEQLLFLSMRQIYGKENVIYYPTYGHALASSPSTNKSMLQQLIILPKNSSPKKINSPITNNLIQTLINYPKIKKIDISNSNHSINDSSHCHFQRPRVRI